MLFLTRRSPSYLVTGRLRLRVPSLNAEVRTMQEKTKHEAADWGSCDMRSYRLAAKKVRGGDGGRWWVERAKGEICDGAQVGVYVRIR